MPNFYIWPREEGGAADSFWVYGLDEYDAREQIAATLRLDTHDEDAFGCREDTRFKVPLNIILHVTGEWTEVATPLLLRCTQDGSNGGSESSEA